MHLSSRARARLDAKRVRLTWRDGRGGTPPVGPVTPGFTVRLFGYERASDDLVLLKLLASLNAGIGVPASAVLVVQKDAYTRSVAPCASGATCSNAASREVNSPAALLWRVEFGLSLEVVESPDSLFWLMADGGVPIALPAPVPMTVELGDAKRALALRGARVRRHLVAFAAGLAVSAASGSAVGIASAGTVPHIRSHPTGSTMRAIVGAAVVTDARATALRLGVPPTSSTHRKHRTTAAPTTREAPVPTRSPHAGRSSTAGEVNRHWMPTHHLGTQPGKRHSHAHGHDGPAHRHASGTHHGGPHGPVDQSQPGLGPAGGKGHKLHPPSPHHTWSLAHRHTSGGVSPAGTPETSPRRAPTPAFTPEPTAPGTPTAAAPSDATTLAQGYGQLAGSSAPAGLFGAIGLSEASLLGTGNQPPAFLIPIYKAAARRFHVPWQILAAINSIETNYGQDLSVSSAGATGWMQFMPDTWRHYGLAVDGHGSPNPYNPWDAIFAAARYLAANGARRDLRSAIYAYNHASWYVEEVLLKAQAIGDRPTAGHDGKRYALPLARSYMHQLGRTDDGVDIEAAPDGALVYSITPGVVTAVASDPSGFGPSYPVIVATEGPLAGQAIYYGHVALSLVRPGAHVSAGQPIAVMGHAGDAASLGHGHIEIGFSTTGGDPLNHHGAAAWTAAGEEMRGFLIELSALYGIRNS